MTAPETCPTCGNPRDWAVIAGEATLTICSDSFHDEVEDASPANRMVVEEVGTQATVTEQWVADSEAVK
jgi:hypothetical protein